MELQHAREGAICLRIEDTGTGSVPQGAGGMGMALIRTFATQLGGTLDVTSKGVGMGTLVTLAIAVLASNL